MESLIKEQEKMAAGSNLSKSVEDVQKTLDLLLKARETIAASTTGRPLGEINPPTLS